MTNRYLSRLATTMKRYKLIRIADCVDSKRRLKRKLASLMILSVLSAIAFFIFWQNHPDISYYLRLLQAGFSFLEENPWALIAVMATLPGLGFPSSPVLVLFGIVIAPHYGMPAAVLLAIARRPCVRFGPMHSHQDR